MVSPSSLTTWMSRSATRMVTFGLPAFRRTGWVWGSWRTSGFVVDGAERVGVAVATAPMVNNEQIEWLPAGRSCSATSWTVGRRALVTDRSAGNGGRDLRSAFFLRR